MSNIRWGHLFKMDRNWNWRLIIVCLAYLVSISCEVTNAFIPPEIMRNYQRRTSHLHVNSNHGLNKIRRSDGNVNDGGGMKGGGSGGGDGNGNGSGKNWGADGFNRGPHIILTAIPFAIKEKYKTHMKQKAVSTITSAYRSGMLQSSSIPIPLQSSKQTLVTKFISSVQNVQHNNIKVRAMECIKWYMTEIEKNPLIVKSLSSGAISLCADFVAQTFEQKKSQQEFNAEISYDRRRLWASLAGGVFVDGPLMHFGYNYFESVIPIQNSMGKSSNRAAILHLLADCVILDSIFVASSFLTTGLLEGHSFQKDIVPQFKNDYLSTMKASWVTSSGLSPLEFACFRFLPVSLRAFAMSMTSIIWDSVISHNVHESRI